MHVPHLQDKTKASDTSDNQDRTAHVRTSSQIPRPGLITQLLTSQGLLTRAPPTHTLHSYHKPTQKHDCSQVWQPNETPTYMAAFAMRGVRPLVNPFIPCSLHSCRTIALSVGL